MNSKINLKIFYVFFLDMFCKYHHFLRVIEIFDFECEKSEQIWIKQ